MERPQSSDGRMRHFYVVEPEAVVVPLGLGEILSRRDADLTSQLQDHNILMMRLNGQASTTASDAHAMLVDNASRVINGLERAEERLMRWLDTDDRTALFFKSLEGDVTGAQSDSPGERLRAVTYAAFGSYVADGRDKAGMSLLDKTLVGIFGPAEAEVVKKIFGDNYVRLRIVRAGQDGLPPRDLVDQVRLLQSQVSRSAYRSVQSVTDALISAWVRAEPYTELRTRQFIIDHICTQDMPLAMADDSDLSSGPSPAGHVRSLLTRHFAHSGTSVVGQMTSDQYRPNVLSGTPEVFRGVRNLGQVAALMVLDGGGSGVDTVLLQDNR
jgi:hypothetical protein